MVWNNSATPSCHSETPLSDVVHAAYSGALHVRMGLALDFDAKMRVTCTKSAANLLLAVFNVLLTDVNIGVQLCCLQNLASFLNLLSSVTNRVDEREVQKLWVAVDQIARQGDWRTQLVVVQQIRGCLKSLPSQSLFGPLLWLLGHGDPVVREAAGQKFMMLIRTVPSIGQRDAFIKKLCKACSDSADSRATLVDALESGTGFFSTLLFSEVFASHILPAAYDPADFVRLRLASSIHLLALPVKDYQHLMQHSVVSEMTVVQPFGMSCALSLSRHRTRFNC